MELLLILALVGGGVYVALRRPFARAVRQPRASVLPGQRRIGAEPTQAQRTDASAPGL